MPLRRPPRPACPRQWTSAEWTLGPTPGHRADVSAHRRSNTRDGSPLCLRVRLSWRGHTTPVNLVLHTRQRGSASGEKGGPQSRNVDSHSGAPPRPFPKAKGSDRRARSTRVEGTPTGVNQRDKTGDATATTLDKIREPLIKYDNLCATNGY